MGNPRKQRKSYKTPSHPWNKARIDEEKILVNEYGLKNKKELWKMHAILTLLKRQAKNLISAEGEQAEKEVQEFLERLARLNLINAGSKIEDVLELSTKDILERRLQTVLYRKGLAKSIKQARQFIVHGHVVVSGKKIAVPSYLVNADEASTVMFINKSNLADPEHPERVVKPKEVVSTVESTEEPKEETPKEEKE